MNSTTTEAARAFWRDSGVPRSKRADIETAISWALPLGVLHVPRLGVAAMRQELQRRNITLSLGPDRLLHACLIARSGSGLVLLDGADPEDERRFSLAHEASHFILDYLEPRSRALARFGSRITGVLDGDRPPTPDERADALLTDAPLGLHTHLMLRNPNGGIGCEDVEGAELAADRLAFELLAPTASVREALPADPSFELITGVLTADFGLPPIAASRYAQRVHAELRVVRPFKVRTWLGLGEPASRTSPPGGE